MREMSGSVAHSGRPIIVENASNWGADKAQKPTHPSLAGSIEGTSVIRAGTGEGTPVSSWATAWKPL